MDGRRGGGSGLACPLGLAYAVDGRPTAVHVFHSSRLFGKLKEKLARLSNQYEELKQREQTLKETMMTAQKITEDMKASARKEAEIILKEAELKSEKMVEDAHRKLAMINDQIVEVKRIRAQFEVAVKAAAQSHLKMLEVTTEALESEIGKDENVKYLVTKDKE